MKNIVDKFKNGAFYSYSLVIYFVIFLVVWFVSYCFLFPNVYNFMIKTSSAKTVGNENTVIVAIDDESIREIDWPWDRENYAKIINFFGKYTDIKALGLDMIISDEAIPSESTMKMFKAVENAQDKIVTAFLPTTQPYPENIDGEIYEKYFHDRFKINIEDKRTNKQNIDFKAISIFPTDYFFSVKNVGSALNPRSDINQTYTKTVSFVEVNGALYPSFSLRMYLLANQTDKVTLYNNHFIVDKTGLVVPYHSAIASNIHFYKYHDASIYSHKKYSAIDIIKSYDAINSGKKPLIDPKEFKDKTVFFGTNARSNIVGLEDAGMTPVGIDQPGVDIQATIYDDFENGNFIVRPNLWCELLITAILCLITFVLVLTLPFGGALPVILGLIAGYFAMNMFVLYPSNIALDTISPVVLIITTLIFGYAFKFIIENKNKEKVKNAMGKYLSQDVMKNVVKNIDDIKLGGKKANVTVLFADIRGFTSMSEKMTAEDVSVILNEYFSAIEPIITKYNGVINKFIGDAVMAIFGDPIEDELHPMKAVLCANEMLKCVRKLRSKWIDENKPEIEIGVGINTGEVFVGNIGSEKRLEYTVIGDTVNIASRIESYNKVYKTKFLIGSTTYEFVKNRVDVIKIGGVTIRGKQKKMDIYEVLRVNNGICDDKNN